MIARRNFFAMGIASVLFVFMFSGIVLANGLPGVRAAIKDKKAKWIADETSVSRLSPGERAMRVKLRKPNRAELNRRHYTESLPAIPTSPAVSVGAALDFTTSPDFSSGVRDQGNCGSCWAFATTGALESYMMRIKAASQDINLSEQVLISWGGAGSCSGGSVDAASNFIRDMGLPQESCYYYIAQNGVYSNACYDWQSSSSKIGTWLYVATMNPTVDAIKNALAQYGPLVTTMDVYTDFFYYKSGVYSYTSGVREGGHAILIVGYDDNLQCFKAKNSWGAGWGEGGYFRIAYSQLSYPTEFGYYTIAYGSPESCLFSLSPTYKNFNAKGGKGTVSVTATAGCKWTAASDSAWLKITSASSLTGTGKVSYSVSTNTGAGRTGIITAAGQKYTVYQSGR